ncbi:TPA: hypothetical protein DCP13_03235 [Candidatus Azambacteria bacterium]|nr:hypothetical protein [Candidatus Azambacteria bacterium]
MRDVFCFVFIPTPPWRGKNEPGQRFRVIKMDKPLVSTKTAKKLQKFLSVGLAVTTTLWLSGFVLLVPMFVLNAAVVNEGDLIRGPDGIKVYIVNAKGYKRHIFNPAVLGMYGHLKWENIKSVDQATLDSYMISDIYRAAGDTKVYQTAQDGIKKWFDMTAEQYVASGYSWDQVFIVNGAERDYYTTGTSIAYGAVPTPVASGLTVGLASDTPATGVVVQNAAKVGFTKVNFTASSEADVIVDSLTVKRIGPSNDTNFSELILVDAATNKQLGAEKTLTSEHTVVFTDDFTVTKGTTRSIILAGNMAAALQASEQASLSLTSVVTKSSVPVVGTLPITGNYMTMNATLTIGTATIANGGLMPSDSNQKVGTTAYIFASLKITSATEDIDLSSIRWYQNGTASDGDLKNLELVSDGVVVGSKVTDVTNKEAIFNFSPAIKISKGLSKEFSLRGDIISGSGRTIDWVIDKKTDITVKGKTYGYEINPTYPNATSPYYNGDDETTIQTGSLTVSKGTLASLNVASGGTQQEIGKFKFNAQGERVIVTKLAIYATSTVTITNLTNVTIYDSAGTVVGGPVDPSVYSGQTTQGRATTTDTIIFPVGISEYTIKGNLNTSFTNNSTLQLGIVMPSGTITAKGETTNNSITANPTSDITGDTATIKGGVLSISTSTTPAAQTVIAGTSNLTFANYVLDATNSGEDVRVTQLAAVIKTSANSIQTDLVNAQLYDGSTALQPVVQPSAVAATTATTTFTLTNPIVVAKGTSKTITLKADVSSSSTANRTFTYGCNGSACATATGVSTAVTVTPTVTNSDGQVMTIATTGTFTVSTDAANPASGLVYGGQTGVAVGELRLTASNEDLDVTSLHFDRAAINTGSLINQINKFYLYDGGTSVASASPTSSAAITFTITAGNLRILKGSSGKKITVKADWNDIGTSYAGASARGFNLTVAEDAYAVKGVSSGSNLAVGNMSGTFTGSSFSLYLSYPTVSYPTPVSGTNLSTGSGTFFKYTISAGSHGDIGLYKASFAVTTTTATATSFQLFENPGVSEVNLWNNATREPGDRIYVNGVAAIGGVTGLAASNTLIDASDTATTGVATGGEYRLISAGTSKNYELRATITGPLVAGSQVKIEMLGDEAFPTTYPLPAVRSSVSADGGAITAAIENKDDTVDRDFIWSDLNYGNNSTTATRTAEWTNGFRVPGLNPNTSTAQILSK